MDLVDFDINDSAGVPLRAGWTALHSGHGGARVVGTRVVGGAGNGTDQCGTM